MTELWAERLEALIGGGIGERSPEAEHEFFTLARDIARWQRALAPPIERLWQHEQAEPAAWTRWTDIPAVPVAAYRELELRTFEGEPAAAFLSSGTTAAQRARHVMSAEGLALYERCSMIGFRAYCLPDGQRLPMLALTPSPEEAPESSLAHMLGFAASHFGAPGGGWYARGGQLDVEALVARCRAACAGDEPLFLLGPVVGLLDLARAVAADPIRLAPGSRIMETGGMKASGRELEPGELHLLLFEALGVPSSHVIGEYGMTELTSQAYDGLLRCLLLDEDIIPRMKEPPPWMRVSAHHPETLEPLPDLEEGLLRIADLSNLGSSIIIQTEDLGYTEGGRFDITGRLEGAPRRGCSLLLEPEA